MAVRTWCPINTVLGPYGMKKDQVLGLIRMNHRMTVLEVISSSRSPMSYSAVAHDTGLNSRTLALVLKELASEKLIDRISISGSRARAAYSATVIGRRIVTMPCPLLRLTPEAKKMSQATSH